MRGLGSAPEKCDRFQRGGHDPAKTHVRDVSTIRGKREKQAALDGEGCARPGAPGTKQRYGEVAQMDRAGVPWSVCLHEEVGRIRVRIQINQPRGGRVFQPHAGEDQMPA